MTEHDRFRFLNLGAALLCLATVASAEPQPGANPAAVAPAPVAVAAARAYQIDPVHSSVSFSVRHLVSRVPGNFRDFEGVLNIDQKNVAGATGKFTAKAASIDTGNEKRDGHLKSADFFDVEKFPDIVFEVKSVKMTGEDAATVTGDFTMHGVTKSVDFAVTDIAFADMGDTGVMGFNGTTKINRKDFGIVWNKTLDAGGFALGDEVTINLNVEAKAKLMPMAGAAAPAGK